MSWENRRQLPSGHGCDGSPEQIITGPCCLLGECKQSSRSVVRCRLSGYFCRRVTRRGVDLTAPQARSREMRGREMRRETRGPEDNSCCGIMVTHRMLLFSSFGHLPGSCIRLCAYCSCSVLDLWCQCTSRAPFVPLNCALEATIRFEEQGQDLWPHTTSRFDARTRARGKVANSGPSVAEWC